MKMYGQGLIKPHVSKVLACTILEYTCTMGISVYYPYTTLDSSSPMSARHCLILD